MKVQATTAPAVKPCVILPITTPATVIDPEALPVDVKETEQNIGFPGGL